MPRINIIVFVTLLISFCSIRVSAQKAIALKGGNPIDSLYNSKQIAIDEIIVSAPVQINKIEQWPGSISVIDSMRILSGNSYQLSEQLNTIPGVVMQQGTMNTNRITIRGVGSRTPYESNRIKAYWGELPLTNGDGVTSIEDMALSDIETIRVLKGPSSALYGAGLGGVILIDPWSSITNNLGVRYKGELGSFKTISNQIHAGIRYSSTGMYSLSISQLHTDGYRDNSRYDRYIFTLKGRQSFGRHYFHILYNYRFLNGQIPSSLDSTDFWNNPQKAAASWKTIGGYEVSNRHLLNLGLNTQLAERLKNSFNVFYGYSNLEELRPFNRLVEDRLSIGIRNKISLKGNHFKADAGLEYMWEGNHLTFYSVDEEDYNQLLDQNDITRSYINIFGLFEYQLHKWTVQLSANINRTSYSSMDKDNDIKLTHHYNWVFSPRLGLNYEWGKRSALFASFGHGFSAPSVEEARLPDASFNTNIQPEEGITADVGYRYFSMDGRTKADLTLYLMELKNLLVTKRESEAVFYGVNAGATRHKGLEFTVNHKFLQIMDKRSFDMTLSYFASANQFRQFVDDGINYNGNHLPGIPEYNLAIDGHIYLKPFHLNVNYKNVGGQYLTDNNKQYYQSYNKAGAKISCELHFGQFRSILYIGADNLFDEHYASMLLINAPSFGNRLPRYYYPGLPFNVYGGLSVKF